MKFDEIIQYEREDAAKKAAREAAATATKAAQIQSVIELLEDLGEIPESLISRLKHADSAALKQFHKIAAKSESIEEFTQKAGLAELTTASAK